MPQFSCSLFLLVSLRIAINEGLFASPCQWRSAQREKQHGGPHVIDFCRCKDFICFNQISFCFWSRIFFLSPLFLGFQIKQWMYLVCFGSRACDSFRLQPNMLSFHAQMAANSSTRNVPLNFWVFLQILLVEDPRIQNNVCPCFPTFNFFSFFYNLLHSQSDTGQWKNEPMSLDVVEPASKKKFFGCVVVACRWWWCSVAMSAFRRDKKVEFSCAMVLMEKARDWNDKDENDEGEVWRCMKRGRNWIELTIFAIF